MTTIAAQESWFSGAAGRFMNPDNVYGYQCVDTYIDYALHLFGRFGGQNEVAGRHNANGLFDVSPSKYWEKIREIPGDPNSIPQRGDVIIWAGNGAGGTNPYGHIAVVESADGMAVRVMQQDGFAQQATHRATLGYTNPGTGPVLGWLRPRLNLLVLDVGPTQRVVGAYGAKGREQAVVGATIAQEFAAGEVLNFKGYVHGDRSADSDVWFVGAVSGKFFHASALDGGDSVEGLPNLTPAPAPAKPVRGPGQRFVGAAGATLRSAPDKNGAAVQVFLPGDLLNLTGYVRATRPYGESSSDAWLVGISGNYVHSSAVDDGDELGDLKDLTVAKPSPLPGVPNVPAPVAEYTFPKRWKTTTAVRPAHISNLQRGGFGPRPTHVVIHQINEPSVKPTDESGITWFETPATTDGVKRNPSSAHLVAQAPRLTEVVDVPVDRAYHAGAIGNGHVGIETIPNPDAATVALIVSWLWEWHDVMGYWLIPVLHKNVPGNSTSCGTYIQIEKFTIKGEIVEGPEVVLEPTPAPVPAPTPAPAEDEQSKGVRSFLEFLFTSWRNARK